MENNDGTIPDNVYQYKRKKHDIWQYTSTGNIPGINGNADMNISYKTLNNYVKENTYMENKKYQL